MPTSTFAGGTDLPVETATAGALSRNGSIGAPLAVNVDGVSIDVNGSNQLELIGGEITGSDTQVLFFDGANNPAGEAGMTYAKGSDALTLAGKVVTPLVTRDSGDLTLSTTTSGNVAISTAGNEIHLSANASLQWNAADDPVAITGGGGTGNRLLNIGFPGIFNGLSIDGTAVTGTTTLASVTAINFETDALGSTKTSSLNADGSFTTKTLHLSGVPASDAGLSAGDIYQTAGVLMIKL